MHDPLRVRVHRPAVIEAPRYAGESLYKHRHEYAVYEREREPEMNPPSVSFIFLPVTFGNQ